MPRKVVILPALFAVVALGLVLALGLWPSGQADASTHSATRTLSESSVEPGDEITVTINASGYGSFGQVVETLPAGFSYVENSTDPSSIRTSVNGQEVRFTLLGADLSFSYRVLASDTPGDYSLTGTLSDEHGAKEDITPDSDVTVTAVEEPEATATPTATPVPPAPSGAGATRSMPSRAGPGAEVTVTIRASNYGSFGQVVETLPAGFSYVDDSTNPSTIRTSVTGQEVAFTLLGADLSFSYKVTAASIGGTHTFSGNLVDDQGNPHTIRDSDIRVDAPIPGATRSLPGSADPGEELTVNIRASNYGSFGQVVETLPEGFSYVDDSTDPSSIRTSVSGQEVTFTLLGADVSFSYKVTAASSGGAHTFTGNLVDDQGNSHAIRESSVDVDAPVIGATRRLPGRVNPGAEVTVNIRASNYGSLRPGRRDTAHGLLLRRRLHRPIEHQDQRHRTGCHIHPPGRRFELLVQGHGNEHAGYLHLLRQARRRPGQHPHDSRFQHQSRQANHREAAAHGHGHAAPQHQAVHPQAGPHVHTHAATGNGHAYTYAHASAAHGHAHASAAHGHAHGHAYSDGHGSAGGHRDSFA